MWAHVFISLVTLGMFYYERRNMWAHAPALPPFFSQKNDQNWTIFSILPYTDGSTKSGHFSTFFDFFFALVRNLKSTFFYFLASFGWGNLANRPKI